MRYQNNLESVMVDLNDILNANDKPPLTLQELAEEVGVSRQAMAAVYKGLSVPTYRVAILTYQALHRRFTAPHKLKPILEVFPVPKGRPEVSTK